MRLRGPRMEISTAGMGQSGMQLSKTMKDLLVGKAILQALLKPLLQSLLQTFLHLSLNLDTDTNTIHNMPTHFLQLLNGDDRLEFLSDVSANPIAQGIFHENLFVPQPARYTYPSGCPMGTNLPSSKANHCDVGRKDTDIVEKSWEHLVTEAAIKGNQLPALHYIYNSLVFDFLCELHWQKFMRVGDATTWRELTKLFHLSTSKLSQDELIQLQKETHFDKKELQQWYKGNHSPSLLSHH